MYRLEGTAFPSVGHLIRYQLSSAVPVTKASQACLIHPVVKVRDEHDLRHEEIELGDKLGAVSLKVKVVCPEPIRLIMPGLYQVSLLLKRLRIFTILYS